MACARDKPDALAFAAAVDIIIAIAMTYFLRRHRGHIRAYVFALRENLPWQVCCCGSYLCLLRRTNSLIQKITTYTIATGALTR